MAYKKVLHLVRFFAIIKPKITKSGGYHEKAQQAHGQEKTRIPDACFACLCGRGAVCAVSPAISSPWQHSLERACRHPVLCLHGRQHALAWQDRHEPSKKSKNSPSLSHLLYRNHIFDLIVPSSQTALRGSHAHHRLPYVEHLRHAVLHHRHSAHRPCDGGIGLCMNKLSLLEHIIQAGSVLFCRSTIFFRFFDINDPADHVGDQRDHVNDQKGNKQRRDLLQKRCGRPEERTQRGDHANDPEKGHVFFHINHSYQPKKRISIIIPTVMMDASVANMARNT